MINFAGVKNKDMKKSMETKALGKQRETIELPVSIVGELTAMASAQGKTLKDFMEEVLIRVVKGVKNEKTANPSPSGDPWFDDPRNLEELQRGIDDAKAGRKKAYTMGEIKEMLGL